MAHKQPLEVLLDETRESRPSLAQWTSDADVRLDEDRAQQVRLISEVQRVAKAAPDDVFMRDGVLAPIGDIVTEHARAEFTPELLSRGRKPQRDRNVRYRDEVEAIRAFYMHEPPKGGDLGKALDRLKLGANIQASTRPPGRTEDPYLKAVGIALATLDPGDVAILRWAHVEFDAARNTMKGDDVAGVVDGASAMAIAARVRENRGTLPSGSNLAAGPHITWSLLVAERLKMPVEGDDGVASAKVIAERAKRARRAVRDRLRTYELDTSPKWVVPPASRKELDRERVAVEVEVCVGAAVIDGRRGTCCVEVVTEDVSARPRCEYCQNPRARSR